MSAYYVYALKDPRGKIPKPFYIGKGTGIRAWQHDLKPDKTRKGEFIQNIIGEGKEVLVTILADNLTELQAIKLESELIVAFGTAASGGMLLNSVIPSGNRITVESNLAVPYGIVEKAQMGLKLLKDAVLEFAKANPDGITNSEIVKTLGLQSDYLGGSKDYLSWSLLGLLMREGRLERKKNSRRHAAK